MCSINFILESCIICLFFFCVVDFLKFLPVRWPSFCPRNSYFILSLFWSIYFVRHLAIFYHVEILCRLGHEHEAAVLLKASASATISAWQTALSSSGGVGGGVVGGGGGYVDARNGDNDRQLANSLPPTLFFSGAQRLRDLSAAATLLSSSSSQLVGACLKQLQRVNDAVVLLLRTETEAARVILEDVVRTDRDLVPAVQNLLYVYVKQGKTSEAIALLRLVNGLPAL